MANKKDDVKLNVNMKEKGIGETKKKVKALRKETQGLQSDTSKVTNTQKGLAQTSGKAGKDFSRQASGMGGLVAAYATVAANVFALSAAYQVLKNAADFDSMIVSSKNLSAATGNDFLGIAKSVQKATGMQLDFADAMAVTNKAVASGIGADKLAEFTSLATKAAQTFGGSTKDALNRMTDAVLRGRTELVNKLGIVISADEAYSNYGQTINKTAQELTSFEKRVAITNAIIEEGNKSVGQTVIDTNPLELLAVTFRDLGQDLLSYATKTEGFLTSILNLFNQSKVAVAGLATVIIGSVLSKLRVSDDELKKRRTNARALAKRSLSQAQRVGKRLNKQNEELLAERLLSDKEYTKKRLKLFADSAEAATPRKLKGRLKSLDVVMEGGELTDRQIKGAYKALENANKNVGALKNVPQKIRKDFERELDFMSGKATSTEQLIRRSSLGINNSLSSIGNKIESTKSRWNIAWTSMQRQYAVASTKIARKGVFTSLPSSMSLMAKGAARLTGAFNKLMGSLGTIGLLVAAGTAAWEWYSKTFRQFENRIAKIVALNTDFDNSQKTLNKTIETSTDKFKYLLTTNTTSSFVMQAKIIGNNVDSIVAKLKEARKELGDTVDISATIAKVKELEEKLKEITNKLPEAERELQQARSSGIKDTTVVYDQSTVGEGRYVALKKESDAYSKLNSLQRQAKMITEELLDSKNKLRIESKEATDFLIKSGTAAVAAMEESVGVKVKLLFDGKIPEKIKARMENANVILQELLTVNPDSENAYSSMQVILEKLQKSLSVTSTEFGKSADTVEVFNKAADNLSTELRTNNTDISVLGKTAQTTWSNLFTDDLLMKAKELGGSLNEYIKSSPELLKSLSKVLGLEPTLDADKVVNRYFEVKKELEDASIDITTNLITIDKNKDDIKSLDLDAKLSQSSKDRLKIEQEKLRVLANTMVAERSILLSKKASLEVIKYSDKHQENARKKEVAKLNAQLKILGKGRDLIQQAAKIRSDNLNIMKSELIHQHRLADIAESRLVLNKDLLIEQAAGITLDIDKIKRDKQDLAIASKRKKILQDIALNKFNLNIEEAAYRDKELKDRLALLDLEKEILDTRRQKDYRKRGAEKDSLVEGMALSLQADIVDATNEANKASAKLGTGFANSIREGVGTLMSGIMDGNFNLTESIAAMGNSVADTISQVATDQITAWILEAFGIKTEAQLQHLEAQVYRERLISAVLSLKTESALTPSIDAKPLLGFDSQAGEVTPTGATDNNMFGSFSDIVMGSGTTESTPKEASIDTSELNKELDSTSKSIGDLTGSSDFLANIMQGNISAVFQQIAQTVAGIASDTANTATETASTATFTGTMGAYTTQIGLYTSQLIAAQASSQLSAIPIPGLGAANGGVLSNKGFTPLANGGIATKSTMYEIGEGRKNEAVVPLPNNREIPVVITGGDPETTVVNNYDFRSADAATEAKIRRMIEASGERTFGKVFSEIDRGGSYAKRTGRRR